MEGISDLLLKNIGPYLTTDEDEATIVKRWSSLGFLDYVEESKRSTLAKNLNDLAKYLLKNIEDLPDNITAVSFPILIRASKNGLKNEFNPESFVKYIIANFVSISDGLVERVSDFGVDIEAEACAEIAKRSSVE
jgi:hypothetical protein